MDPSLCTGVEAYGMHLFIRSPTKRSIRNRKRKEVFEEPSCTQYAGPEAQKCCVAISITWRTTLSKKIVKK